VNRRPVINSAYHISDRVTLRLSRLAGGREPADIRKLLSYRRDFFGDPFTAWVEDVLRGPSSWSIGERELIAAFVSSRNKCRLSGGSHAGVASTDVGSEMSAAVLADWRTAPITNGLRSALGFAEKLTQQPENISVVDIAPMRVAGLTADEIDDVVHICAIFSTINRIADTAGFGVPDDLGPAVCANLLL
jgi:uncharacterized peroxidase-related enzyme